MISVCAPLSHFCPYPVLSRFAHSVGKPIGNVFSETSARLDVSTVQKHCCCQLLFTALTLATVNNVPALITFGCLTDDGQPPKRFARF